MADISKIKTLDGTTYDLKDATARSNKVEKSGDTMTGNLLVPAVRVANTYYGISFDRTTATPVETILYTGIKWVSGLHMPVVHVTGYAYGLHMPVEFKIGFYIYGNKIGYCGATNMGAWNPKVYLFKYTRSSVDYVAIGFAGSCYFLQLSVDLQDEMGKFANVVTDRSAWSWSFLTTAGTIPSADDGSTCVQVSYKADILNPSKVNGHTINSDVPANAKFTDTKYTANTSKLVTTTVPNVTSAGSAPTLGTAIPADDITAWTTNTPTAFEIIGEKLKITAGKAATLSYTAKSIPNVTSVGSAPTLGTAITVATGALASNGAGSSVVTGITGT